MEMDSSSSKTDISLLSNDLIMLLTSHSLGASKKFVKSQDIMAKAFRLVKEKFCWSEKKYEKYPDIETMRKALFAARSNGYLIGAYDRKLLKDGWKITSKGIKKIEEINVNTAEIHGSKSGSTIPTVKKKLIKSFINNFNIDDLNDEDFNIYTLAEILKTPANNIESIRARLFEILNLCELSNNDKCLESISAIVKSEKFKNLFDESDFLNQKKARYKAKEM